MKCREFLRVLFPGRLRDILHCSLVLCPQNRRRYQRIHAICVQLGQVEINLSFIYFSSFLFFGNLLKKKKRKLQYKTVRNLTRENHGLHRRERGSFIKLSTLKMIFKTSCSPTRANFKNNSVSKLSDFN